MYNKMALLDKWITEFNKGKGSREYLDLLLDSIIKLNKREENKYE